MVRKKANMTVEHIMIERTISVTNDPFIEINGGVNGTCVSKSCWYTKRVLRERTSYNSELWDMVRNTRTDPVMTLGEFCNDLTLCNDLRLFTQVKHKYK